MQVNGRPASSTNAATWTTFEAVAEIPHGIMLGDGLGCYDLDHVIDDAGELHQDAATVLADVGRDALWIERSMSGRGLHVFVRAPEAKGIVGERVSFYSWGRFIAVTGDRYRRSAVCAV